MSTAKDVAQFIHETFREYGLSYSAFFSYYDDDAEETFERPISENDQLIMPIVDRCAMMLGVDTEDLLELNTDATMKWYKKYSYFQHKQNIEYSRWESFQSSDVAADRILCAIFDAPFSMPSYPTRYNYHDVTRRMNALLDELGQTLPDSCPQIAEGKKLAIETENFYHYSDISEAVSSYLEMARQFETLFFRAVKDDYLSAEDEEEYNFLVSVFGIKDTVALNYGYLYYETLTKFTRIYRKEAFKQLLSYVRMDRNRLFRPWQCAEFSTNESLVQDFVNVFPHTKADMRRFAMQVSHFVCSYRWTDETKNYAADLLSQLFGEQDPDYPEPVYVLKTQEELAGDDTYTALLHRLSGPPKLGGVSVPKPEPETAIFNEFGMAPECLSRLNARIAAYGPRAWEDDLL